MTEPKLDWEIAWEHAYPLAASMRRGDIACTVDNRQRIGGERAHFKTGYLAALEASQAEVERLKADIMQAKAPAATSAELARALSIVQFFVDCAIVSGTHPSGAPKALATIAAALGLGKEG